MNYLKRGMLALALLVAAASSAGCGFVTLRSDEAAREKRDALEATARSALAQVEPHRSDRPTVRERLGTPWASNDLFGFDVFRLDSSSVVPMAFVVWAPYPVPIPYASSEHLYRYLFVTYDEAGLVESALAVLLPDHSQVSGPGWHSQHLAESSGVSVVHMWLDGTDGLTELHVGPDRRQQRLALRHEGTGCPVLIGCFECDPLKLEAPTRLLLDERDLDPLAVRSGQLRVSAGPHRVTVAEQGAGACGEGAAEDGGTNAGHERRCMPGTNRASAVLDCADDRPLFVTVYPTWTPRKSWHLVATNEIGDRWSQGPLVIGTPPWEWGDSIEAAE